MDNINVITILNALADQLQRAKLQNEELTAQNEEYKHDNKELYGFICNLEKELADKDAIIARLEGELKKAEGARQIPCVNCASFDIVDGVRKCFKWGKHFPDGGIADPLYFSCSKARSRAGGAK